MKRSTDFKHLAVFSILVLVSFALVAVQGGTLTARCSDVSPSSCTSVLEKQTNAYTSANTLGFMTDAIKNALIAAKAQQEQAAKDAEQAQKEAAEAAEKAQNDAAKEAEKAQKQAEKAQKQAEKDAEKAQKAAEKAQKEADKQAAKDQKAKEKEEKKVQKAVNNIEKQLAKDTPDYNSLLAWPDGKECVLNCYVANDIIQAGCECGSQQKPVVVRYKPKKQCVDDIADASLKDLFDGYDFCAPDIDMFTSDVMRLVAAGAITSSSIKDAIMTQASGCVCQGLDDVLITAFDYQIRRAYNEFMNSTETIKPSLRSTNQSAMKNLKQALLKD